MKPLTEAEMPAGISRYQVTRWQDQRRFSEQDYLAEEVPVALVFNGISYAVMMASPTDLHDFALGFAITEGLLEHPHELYGMDIEHSAAGIELQLEVAAACEWRLKKQRRNLTGRTGCGLCGSESLAQVHKPLSTVSSAQTTVAAVTKSQQALPGWQVLQQQTGAVHAAAWCTLTGDIQLVREDLGRHNALDKLIGALLKTTTDRSQGFICITSRASFEMVQKTLIAGVGLLAAVSAPTALAVDIARQHNLALAGFVRGDRLVAYAYPERFGLLP